MENGSNGPLTDVQVSEHTKNGVVTPIMAKLPEGNIDINQQDKPNFIETVRVNGDGNNIFDIINNEEHSCSSESDALVIDESICKKEKIGRKKNNLPLKVTSEEDKDISDTVTHSNPYFNESLFELSQLHQSNHEVDAPNETLENAFDKNGKKLKKKNKPKQKIREYAQYLGLQPSVQFKCPKCNRAGFESLSSLQDHVVLCDEEFVQEILQDNSYSGFKLTRKVFLCSACGTYYENWNLYIHMLEFHKRFICLYCLGMFSILEDLCQHIQSRHNIEPGYKNTLDEFFDVYNEPCYIACCECNKLFSEQDNFFYHHCISKNKCKKTIKQQITPENHVTGESEPFVETNTNMEGATETSNMEICDNLKNTGGLEFNQKQDTVTRETETNNKTQINCQGSKTIINNTVCNNTEESKENSTENVIDTNEDNCNLDYNMISQPTQELIDDIDKSDSENVISTETKNNEIDIKEEQSPNEFHDTRKVPKLSLKLPKLEESYEAEAEDSDDSDKLTMEIDQIESEYENENNEIDGNSINPNPEMESHKQEVDEEKELVKKEAQLQIAGPDISVIELQLEQPLDKFDPRILLQKCLKMTIPTCIYCNHARKIAVNGKQLGLHCIAEHRFSAVVNSITAEELIPQSFVNRIKECMDELSSVFFNLDSSFSNEAITFSHLFECFQCHFSTTVHKELYLHNRKYHSKNLLLCIMCKSNFYSYSELICHLCPGVYVLDYELKFRCCMCVHDDLPSSFRMMVHLRKKHNVCDVCLETCHTQHRLSNHVWKHKLHHFCYRCGIAYRNKPDITRHLFWKHGTESVMCKKCLQKKWPHVYHFCVPPTSFICDECSLMFTRAVSLKVHKRLHSNEKKHVCTFEGCEEKFISKKLLEKHFRRHLEPAEEPKIEEPEANIEIKEEEKVPELVIEEEKIEEKPKPKIDVLEDLPALNLSESDSSSDSENEETTNKIKEKSKDTCLNPETELEPPGELPPLDILQEAKAASDLPSEESTSTTIHNIWENFKTYQEQQQKLDNLFVDQEKPEGSNIPIPDVEEEPNVNVILQDHDYCVNTEQKAVDTTIVEVKPALQESVDHDYCFAKPKADENETPSIEQPPVDIVKNNKIEEKKPASSSSSSSDSDSSSCSCGSNCSCSSSSGSSSSSSNTSSSESSSEEGKKRQLLKKQKRKERAKKLKEQKEKAIKVDVTAVVPVVVETPIRESDLETTESETDEEFYDEAPQKLAKKILEEKRQQLLELMGPNSIPNGSFIESTSRPPTPPAEAIEPEERKKKKSKSKKKKRKKSEKRALEIKERELNNIIPPDIPIPPYYQQFHQKQQIHPQSVAPITLTISRSSPISSPSVSIYTSSTPTAYHKVQTEPAYSKQDSLDSSLRASKRRRVRNKFYGYSSDEDQDKPSHKWRKTEAPQPPRSPHVVPPITIKTQPPPPLQPPIEPISIRTGTHLSDFRVARPRPKPSIPPIRLLSRRPGDRDSASDSNDSSSEEPSITPKHSQPQLYCYCQCPYDEVSEMIGCDATDCAIEWFHFECVGIMVPPKGQWFCPDCRKKKARREIMQSMKSQSLN